MKLYQLPDKKYIALDALIHLGDPFFNENSGYYENMTCEATFALIEKPITICLAVRPENLLFKPLSNKIKKANLATFKRGNKELAKLIQAWRETQFKQ